METGGINILSKKQINKILCLHSQELPIRRIAKRIGASPTTVNEYINPKKESYKKRINNSIYTNVTYTFKPYNNTDEQNKENPIEFIQLILSKFANSLQEQIDQIKDRQDPLKNEIDQLKNNADHFYLSLNPIWDEIEQLKEKNQFNNKIDQLLLLFNPILNKIEQSKEEQTSKNQEFENKHKEHHNKLQEIDNKQQKIKIKQDDQEIQIQKHNKIFQQILNLLQYNQNQIKTMQNENKIIKFRLNSSQNNKKNKEQKKHYIFKPEKIVLNKEQDTKSDTNIPQKKFNLVKQNNEPLEEENITKPETKTQTTYQSPVTPFYKEPYFWKNLLDGLRKSLPSINPDNKNDSNQYYGKLKYIPKTKNISQNDTI